MIVTKSWFLRFLCKIFQMHPDLLIKCLKNVYIIIRKDQNCKSIDVVLLCFPIPPTPFPFRRKLFVFYFSSEKNKQVLKVSKCRV